MLSLLQLLGFLTLVSKFIISDPDHASKNIKAYGYFLKPISEHDEVEKGKYLNQVSIWRSPFFIIYQCVIRTIYSKMGDKGSCNGYCIDLMYRLYEHPNRKINVPHFLWHEIRLASLQYKRAFPHAPFLQALIESIAPFPIARTHVHLWWVIPPHMADDWAPKKSSTARWSAAQSRPTPLPRGLSAALLTFSGRPIQP